MRINQKIALGLSAGEEPVGILPVGKKGLK